MNKLSISEWVQFGVEIEYIDISYRMFQKTLEDLGYIGWSSKAEENITRSKDTDWGGEVTSPKLHNNLSDLNELKEVCQLLKNRNAKADSQCGAHLHFDATKLNVDNIKYLQNLLLLFIYYEDIIFRYAAGADQKLRPNYINVAKPIRNTISKENMRHLLIDTKEYEDLKVEFMKRPSKCYSINFRNLVVQEKYTSKLNTIEFRIPNGTLNEDIWFNNINTFGLLIEYALKMPDSKRELLIKKIEKEYDKKFDYELKKLKKAKEFISLIAKCPNDEIRFMNQYQKTL